MQFCICLVESGCSESRLSQNFADGGPRVPVIINKPWANFQELSRVLQILCAESRVRTQLQHCSNDVVSKFLINTVVICNLV